MPVHIQLVALKIDGRERVEDIANCPWSLLRRCHQIGGQILNSAAPPKSDDDQPTTALRHSEVGGLHDVRASGIAQVRKLLHEGREAPIPPHAWNVLNQHCSRLKRAHKANYRQNQVVSLDVFLNAPLSERREALAWRAGLQEREFTDRESQTLAKPSGSDGANVALLEANVWVVRAIGASGVFFDLHRAYDRETCVLQTLCRAPGAREQVNRQELAHPTTLLRHHGLPTQRHVSLSIGRTMATSEEASAAPYTMRISRLTIDKLGIKLYDRVSAVLAELIANSYDADATEVIVSLPWGVTLATKDPKATDPAYEIRVSDNGHGMTSAEVNTNYLVVGADRRLRTGTDKSRDRSRPVMGRKGIGKLAPFGICQTIEVISAGSQESDKTPAGWPTSHVVLNLNDMLTDIETEYEPEVGALDGTFSPERGTTVVLKDFLRKRVASGPELDRQLAARFGLSRTDWVVRVENSAAEDTDGIEDRQFYLGDLKVDMLEGTKIEVNSRPVSYDDNFLPVSGWVGYAKVPYKDETMAGVRIFARGKLVAQTRDFGIVSGFTGEFKLRSYLVGVIHADWLDDDEDLIRSDRQDIIWNSEQGEALQQWGMILMRELAKLGESSVKKKVWDEFLERSDLEKTLKEIAPGDKNFRESVTSAAKLLVSNKDRAALEDEEHVKNVVRLALSLGPQRSLLQALSEIADESENTLETVVRLFEQARIAEVYSLGQIASERVAVLHRLAELISDEKTLEGPLQELIEQAPWLLAPEWTFLGMNESLKRVRGQFESWYQRKHGEQITTTAIGSPRREPDFVMLNDAGTLWIVEIKRVEYQLSNEEYERAVNYLYELDAFLNENAEIGKQFPHRRLTFVVDNIDKLSRTSTSSLDSDDRIDRRTWMELLDSTQRAHKDFLTRVYELQQGEGTANGEEGAAQASV